MPEFTLKRNIVKTLKVNIDEGSYSIPLGGSITPAQWAQIQTPEGTREFIGEYIPKEITDTLTMDEWNAIIDEWKVQTSKTSNKNVGE